jgi:ubiquinol oxidase
VSGSPTTPAVGAARLDLPGPAEEEGRLADPSSTLKGNTLMSVLTAPTARPGTPASPSGPPKLSGAGLRRAQAETLRTPRFRYSIPARLLFWMVDVIYGRQRTLRKFIVLEIVARVPYQAWERAAYGALTRMHSRLRLAGRIFERVVETRAQQDNEQYHLLILEELAQRQGSARPFLRFRLLPWLMAVGYYQLSWLLYVCWPAASYRLNAAFEDHAEHDYMLFVTEHPEWEGQPYDGSFQAGYGHRGSLADLFRQIGHDERVHKLESLAALDEPRLRDDLSTALKARSQRLSADHRQPQSR